MGRSKSAAKSKMPQVTLHHVTSIPLNQLVLSAANVRKLYEEKAIADLAEDIARRGLLQSLVSRPTEVDADVYEVHAGGRRLRALQLLLKQKRIAADAPIPCTIKADGIAEDDSLSENVMREALHPLDEFRAFKAMLDKGMSETDIAAAHRVTPTVVKQRLRLANASPALLEAYADEELTLEQLMAYCVTEDHARQDQVFAALADKPDWQKDAHDIRRLLTEKMVHARDRRVRFIGLETYEQAGGFVQRDFFDEDNEGYLQDAELLNRLVMDKLNAERDRLLAKGWKWVEAAVYVPYSELSKHRRLVEATAVLSDEEEDRLDALRNELFDLEDIEEPTEEQQARANTLEAEIDALENREPVYSPEDMAKGGAFLSIGHDGSVDIAYGYLKPEDVALQPREPGAEPLTGAEPSDDEETKLKPLPDSLLQDLTAYRTQALRTALGRDFTVAFMAALHALCIEHFFHFGSKSCLQISARGGFHANVEGLEAWKPTKDYEARDSELRALLPEDAEDVWAALWKLTDNDREALFAQCVAGSLNAVREKHNMRTAEIANSNDIANALGFNMVATGWQATGKTYLDRVSKAHIVAAVGEAKGDDTTQYLNGMKKEGLVREAERLLAGSGWLPEVLRNGEATAPNEAREPDTELPAFLAQTSEAAL